MCCSNRGVQSDWSQCIYEKVWFVHYAGAIIHSNVGNLLIPAACASAGVCTLLVDWAELALMFSIDSLYSLNLLCCFLMEAAVHKLSYYS